MTKVHYMDGDEIICTQEGYDRADALDAHGDENGTGQDYADNPAGGCYMAAEHADGTWSVYRPGRGWGHRYSNLQTARYQWRA